MEESDVQFACADGSVLMFCSFSLNVCDEIFNGVMEIII